MAVCGGGCMGFVNRVFVNGILSSAYTWLSKIAVGNLVNTLTNNLDIGVAAAVGKFMTGEEHVQIGEMVANMHGQISATGDAFRMAYRIVKTGESLGSVVRFTEGAPQDTNRILPEINGTTFGKVMNVVDQVINSPGSRFVNAVDSFNQTLAYRGYMERQAYIAVDDALSSGTLKQQDAAAFVTKMMSNPDPAMQQAAEAWATRMSFQDPLGESGQAITNWLQKNPAACSSARRSPASEPLKVQQGQRSRGLGKLEEHSVGSDFPIGIPARYDWVIVHS